MRPSCRLTVVTCIAIVIAGACDGTTEPQPQPQPGTEPSNTPPVATFTASCDQLACVFENASTDVDGAIAAYAWDFGDGGTSSDSSPTHSYAAPGGEFTVTLAVTDDDGDAVTASQQLTVSQELANVAPAAVFSVSCVDLTCHFVDESTDPDPGDSVVSRLWDFGDTHTSTDTNPSHTYEAPGGQFSVTLTVTDKHGASATATQAVAATGEPTPDGSLTYERVTPHSTPGRQSRYVIRPDGTFEYIEDNSSGQMRMSGRWQDATGLAVGPNGAILLDFDALGGYVPCGGEGIGSFLLEDHMGISLCGVAIGAGLEEGVYSKAPNPGTPDIPAPQAGQIAFVRDGKIFRANTDGTGLVQLSTGPDDGNPAWSPDGSRIAFTRGGAAPGIYLMTADGANPVLRAGLHEHSHTTAAPTWSPDGEWIAFACFGDGDWGLCKVKAANDGSTPEVFFERSGYLSYAAWSPDGSRIAFTSDWNMFDFWFDVWVVTPDGTQPVVLRHHSGTLDHDEQWQPAWSPDGSRIALVECPWAFYFCSSSVIAVMNADGSNRVRVAAASGFARPTWSPDGQTIAFASGSSIEWVSADGSQRGRIIDNARSPAWRP